MLTRREHALLLGVLGAACFVAGMAATKALSHEAPTGWTYGLECCSGIDCAPADHGEVIPTPNGYLITPTGEMVPFNDKRIRQSRDGDYHWCRHMGGPNKGRTICLYVPPMGS